MKRHPNGKTKKKRKKRMKKIHVFINSMRLNHFGSGKTYTIHHNEAIYNFEEAIFAINPKGLVVVGGGFVWRVPLQNFQTIKWRFLHIFAEHISSTAKIMESLTHPRAHSNVGGRETKDPSYVHHTRELRGRAW